MKNRSDSALYLEWDAVAKRQWEDWSATAGRSSLEQSWAYGSAVAAAQNCQVRRGLVRQGRTPLALFQVFAKYVFLPLRFHQALRGPILLPQGRERPRPVLRAIRSEFRLRNGRLLLWMPDLEDGAETESLVTDCGWRRMSSGYSTLWLDLEKTEAELRAGLHGKWRNALVAAERGPLRCQAAQGGAGLDWLLENYAAYRKRKAFAGPSAKLVRALAEAADRESVLILTALRGNQPQAAILLLRHGASATYYVSYSAPEGRREKAHNLLLWQAIVTLKARGVRWFDLGGVNAAAPGVARFKLGMGGEFVTLTGCYL